MGSKRSTDKMRRAARPVLRRHASNCTASPATLADRIYERLLAFANFGFAETHALSFASLVFYSSWLKLHHPAAFCAALLRAQPMGFYSPQSLVADARRHGVRRARARTSTSAWRTPTWRTPETAVRLGLGAVRHIGDELAQRMVDERKANGPFASLLDLTGRLQLTVAADRGACDGRRAGLLRDHPPRGAVGGRGGGRRAARPATRRGDVVARARAARDERGGTGRRRRLGHRRLAGQLSDEFLRAELDALGVVPADRLLSVPDGTRVLVAGAVTHRQRPATAQGVTFMNLEDETGMVNVMCSPGVWSRHRKLAQTASALVIRGIVQNASGAVTVVADRMSRIDMRVSSRSRDFR